MQKVKLKQIDFGGTNSQYVKGDGSLGNIRDIVGSNAFVFTLTDTNTDNVFTCDKSIDEILSAIQNEETVVAKYDYDGNISITSSNVKFDRTTINIWFNLTTNNNTGVLAIIVGTKENDNDVWRQTDTLFYLKDEQLDKLAGIERNAEKNVQADWNQDDSSKDSYIKNKPTIPTKLSDLLNDSSFALASDVPTEATVSNWGFTKNAGTITGIKMNGITKTTPSIIDLGTVITAHQDISSKADKVQNATNNNFAALDSNGNLKDSGKKASDFVTGGTLANYYTKSQVDSLVASVYKPQGSINSISNLGSLDFNHYGFVYNISTSFSTTSDFVEGANVNYPAGTNVVIINTGTEENPIYKYDVLSGIVDLSPFARTEDLGAVATSNDYDDLDNKPTIPSPANNAKLNIKTDTNTSTELFSANANVNKTLQFLSGDNVSLEEDKSTSNVYKLTISLKDLASVAKSGSYNDLINRPVLVVSVNQINTYDSTSQNNSNLFSNASHTFSQIEAAINNNITVLLVIKNSQFKGSERLLLPVDNYIHNSFISFMYVTYSSSNIIKYDIGINSSNAWFMNVTTISISGEGSGGTASNIFDLNDVSINALTNNQILKYNAALGKWENKNASVDTFICTFSGNVSEELTCDKTIEEIIAAHRSGKDVKAIYGEEGDTFQLPLGVIDDHYVTFQILVVVFGLHLVYFEGDNSTGTDVWSGGIFSYSEVAFSGDYEDLQNKPTLGTASELDVAESGNASTTQVVKGDDSRLSDARTPTSHTHSTSDITDFPTIPAAVSGTNDGTNWTAITIGDVTKNIPSGGGGGGLTNYDFIELTPPTITNAATTIIFAANQRNTVELSTNADLSIALVSNNKADNYIWITNSHSTDDIDVTFSSVSFGNTTINDIRGTDNFPTIKAGETIEIGVHVTDTKARITSVIL